MMFQWNLKAKIFMVLISFLLPIVLLETTAALLLRINLNKAPQLSVNEIEDSELIWKQKPGRYDEYNGPINSLGFRGPEVSAKKEPGVYRILSLGESTAYGDGMAWDKTYAARLESELNIHFHRVQVINAAVRAWSTVQSVNLLKMQIGILQPDLVVFYHEVNDFLPTTWRGIKFETEGLNDEEVIKVLKKQSIVLWISSHSRFLKYVRLTMLTRHADKALKKVAAEQNKDLFKVSLLPYGTLPDRADGQGKPRMSNTNKLVRVPDRLREKYLTELIRATNKAGVKLLLIHPAYRASRPHTCILTELAEQHKIPLLDVEDLLFEETHRTYTSKESFYLDFFHPNEAGHALISKALSAMIIKGNYLPPHSRKARPDQDRSGR